MSKRPSWSKIYPEPPSKKPKLGAISEPHLPKIELQDDLTSIPLPTAFTEVPEVEVQPDNLTPIPPQTIKVLPQTKVPVIESVTAIKSAISSASATEQAISTPAPNTKATSKTIHDTGVKPSELTKQASWASNYLLSIGHSTLKPIKINLAPKTKYGNVTKESPEETSATEEIPDGKKSDQNQSYVPNNSAAQNNENENISQSGNIKKFLNINKEIVKNKTGNCNGPLQCEYASTSFAHMDESRNITHCTSEDEAYLNKVKDFLEKISQSNQTMDDVNEYKYAPKTEGQNRERSKYRTYADNFRDRSPDHKYRDQAHRKYETNNNSRRDTNRIQPPYYDNRNREDNRCVSRENSNSRSRSENFRSRSPHTHNNFASQEHKNSNTRENSNSYSKKVRGVSPDDIQKNQKRKKYKHEFENNSDSEIHSNKNKGTEKLRDFSLELSSYSSDSENKHSSPYRKIKYKKRKTNKTKRSSSSSNDSESETLQKGKKQGNKSNKTVEKSKSSERGFKDTNIIKIKQNSSSSTTTDSKILHKENQSKSNKKQDKPNKIISETKSIHKSSEKKSTDKKILKVKTDMVSADEIKKSAVTKIQNCSCNQNSRDSDTKISKRNLISKTEEMKRKSSCKGKSEKELSLDKIAEKKLSKIKSVVKVNDDSQKTVHENYFDLRSKLSRKTIGNYFSRLCNQNANYRTENKTGHENLVITVTNQQDGGINKTNNSIAKEITQTIRDISKTKKNKKIKVVINVTCEDSQSSDSDDGDSTVRETNKNKTLANDELSFLDDLNIDEIVDSLLRNKNEYSSTQTCTKTIVNNSSVVTYNLISDSENSDASTVHLEELSEMQYDWKDNTEAEKIYDFKTEKTDLIDGTCMSTNNNTLKHGPSNDTVQTVETADKIKDVIKTEIITRDTNSNSDDRLNHRALISEIVVKKEILEESDNTLCDLNRQKSLTSQQEFNVTEPCKEGTKYSLDNVIPASEVKQEPEDEVLSEENQVLKNNISDSKHDHILKDNITLFSVVKKEPSDAAVNQAKQIVKDQNHSEHHHIPLNNILASELNKETDDKISYQENQINNDNKHNHTFAEETQKVVPNQSNIKLPEEKSVYTKEDTRKMKEEIKGNEIRKTGKESLEMRSETFSGTDKTNSTEKYSTMSDASTVLKCKNENPNVMLPTKSISKDCSVNISKTNAIICDFIHLTNGESTCGTYKPQANKILGTSGGNLHDKASTTAAVKASSNNKETSVIDDNISPIFIQVNDVILHGDAKVSINADSQMTDTNSTYSGDCQQTKESDMTLRVPIDIKEDLSLSKMSEINTKAKSPDTEKSKKINDNVTKDSQQGHSVNKISINKKHSEVKKSVSYEISNSINDNVIEDSQQGNSVNKISVNKEDPEVTKLVSNKKSTIHSDESSTKNSVKKASDPETERVVQILRVPSVSEAARSRAAFLKQNGRTVISIEEVLSQYYKETYKVTSVIHRSKFSTIFQCKNSKDENYAVKMKNRAKNAAEERLLMTLQTDIPQENLNIVRIIEKFQIPGHLCYLMDHYPKSLSEVIKGESKTPFYVRDVQNLSRQLVAAVTVLRQYNIVHSDIKPEHVLLNSSNDKLKLCGFDRAYYIHNHPKYVPSIGSVNYRAPEIILGYSAGFSIDVWSTALVMYEMATARTLFPGQYDNDILFKQMCTLGYIPMDMIQQSQFGYKHFNGPTFKRKCGEHGEKISLKGEHEIYRNTLLRGTINQAYYTYWRKNNTNKRHCKEKALLQDFGQLLEEMLAVHPNNRMPIEFVYANPFLFKHSNSFFVTT